MNTEGKVVIIDRLVVITQAGKSDSLVVESIGIAGVDLEYLIKTGDGFIKHFQSGKGDTLVKPSLTIMKRLLSFTVLISIHPLQPHNTADVSQPASRKKLRLSKYRPHIINVLV